MWPQRRSTVLAAFLAFLPLYVLSQPTLDSQVWSEQGSLIQAGSIELLSVGGQAANAEISQDVVILQLGNLFTLPLASKPLAAITSPVGEGLCSIVNGLVTVEGTVESAILKDYSLEYAQGANAASGFILLSSGTATITGALAEWNTSGLIGPQTLRLTAIDTSGGSMTASVSVFVGQPSVAVILEGLGKPEGVAEGNNGSLYVADTHNDRVIVLTSTGGILTHYGGFQKPSGVGIDRVGNIYVADTQNDRVAKLAPDGTVLMTFGNLDKKRSLLQKPQGVSVDTVGRVYVADTGNHSIRIFDPDGTELLHFSLPGGGKPLAVSVAKSGNIYTTDEKGNQVLKYDASGRLLKIIGTGFIKDPGGLAIEPDEDCLFVADSGHDRVVRFDRFGNHQAVFTGLDTPAGLALTSSGELLIADRKNDRLLKLKFSAPPLSVRHRRGHGRAEGKVARNRDGKVERDDGTGVRVPSGALTSDLEITVDRADEARDADIKHAKRKGRKIQAASEEIEYGPEGTTFNKPVTLVLAYDRAQVAAQGINENDLKVYYWNKLLSDWEPMPSFVDKVNRTVSALTTHFSGYQVQGPGTGIGTAATVDEFFFREAYAFPNPVRDTSAVTLRIQPGLADSVEVRIYDLSGRRIHSSSDFRFSVAAGEDTYDHAWDVSGVGSGVYAFVIRARKAGYPDIIKAGKIGVIK